MSILKKINALNSAPIGDIYHCSNEIKNLVILNGGYPINFSQKSISVPDREIQLTRGLLLSACIQAQKILNNKKNKPDSNLLMLEPSLQQSVVRQWEKETIWLKEKKDLLKQFSKLEWIINHSSGYYQHGHNAPKEITDNRPEHSLDQIAST